VALRLGDERGLGGPSVGDAVGQLVVPAEPADPADQLGGRGLGIGLGRPSAARSHYRTLAAARPDAFLSDLAMSLNTPVHRWRPWAGARTR
jgi:hypothetical protein